MAIIAPTQYKPLAVFLASILIAGCSSGSSDDPDDNGQPVADTGDSVEDTGDDTAVTEDGAETSTPVVASAFRTIQETVFTPICSECHGAVGASAGLRLDESASFAAIVNVASTEVPTLSRISPGDPDNSYLIQKLEGTQAIGARMPLGGPFLSEETIGFIRQWVSDGALPDTQGALALAPRVVSASIEQGATLERMPNIVTIVWSSPVDSASFSNTTVSLKSSGGDGTFIDGNETSIGVTSAVSDNPYVTTLFTNDQKPDDDIFQLQITGDGDIYARSTDSTAIDGNGNGVAGGNFVRDFIIE